MDLTRRGFLARMSITTGIGVAAGPGLTQLKTPTGADRTPAPSGGVPAPAAAAVAPMAFGLDTAALPGAMVIHVRDLPTAEVSVMVGDQEMVYRDPDLVARVVTAAARAVAAEA